MASQFDILLALKDKDSCSWFYERTYSIRFPSKAEVHLSPSVPPFGAVPFCPKVLLSQPKKLRLFFNR